MSDWTIEKAQKAVPTVAADIDAEIAYCEARLELLKAAKKQADLPLYPRWVYKEEPKPEPTAKAAVAAHLVQSEAEHKALGAGWGDHPAAVTDKDASKAGETHNGTPSVLDGHVSDVAAYVASVNDAETLKALKAQERKGKARQGVYDAIDARLAELKGA